MAMPARICALLVRPLPRILFLFCVVFRMWHAGADRLACPQRQLEQQKRQEAERQEQLVRALCSVAVSLVSTATCLRCPCPLWRSAYGSVSFSQPRTPARAAATAATAAEAGGGSQARAGRGGEAGVLLAGRALRVRPSAVSGASVPSPLAVTRLLYERLLRTRDCDVSPLHRHVLKPVCACAQRQVRLEEQRRQQLAEQERQVSPRSARLSFCPRPSARRLCTRCSQRARWRCHR
jgi:hypothetical protein